MKQLTSWEFADFAEFLAERDHAWQANEDGDMFLHISGDSVPLMAIRIERPQETGVFRMFGIEAIPVTWSTSDSDDFLAHVLQKFTGYGMRLQFALALQAELKLDHDTSMAMAIVLGRIVSAPDGGFDTPPDQLAFETDRAATLPSKPNPKERIYLLQEGGYVKIELRGGMLATTLSLPSGLSEGMIAHPLRGHVRPKFGSNEDAAAHLFGWGAATKDVKFEIGQQGVLDDSHSGDGAEEAQSSTDSELPDSGGAARADHS